ncbi:HAD family hydrolase [Sporosarcina sp. NPDC096371]|uniref:HAD family hydrolase n=1 Tax=Sporosarcina sp. NPDC096371 TaxID=3364530 RepID=UPI00382E4DF9
MDTVIFDVDDTLYDQLNPFKRAFILNFKHLSNVPIEKLYVSSRRYSDTLFNKSEAGTISLLELHTYRIIAACKEFDIDIDYNEAIEFQNTYEIEQKKITLIPEMEKLIELLYQKNKQLGILTNGPHQHQLTKINQLGLTRWIPIENMFISEAIGSAKPSSSAFHIVERKLQLNKDKTVYIGDSFENDIIGAKKVGWNAIWMNHRKKNRPVSTISPDKIVDRPKELFGLIDSYL